MAIASSIAQSFDYYLLHGFSIDNVSTKREISYTVYSSDVKRKIIVLYIEVTVDQKIGVIYFFTLSLGVRLCRLYT